MGFTQVALVGFDHNFATKGPDHKLVSAADDDPNHFDFRYFAGGVDVTPFATPVLMRADG
jgi:hypothetical protein